MSVFNASVQLLIINFIITLQNFSYENALHENEHREAKATWIAEPPSCKYYNLPRFVF